MSYHTISYHIIPYHIRILDMEVSISYYITSDASVRQTTAECMCFVKEDAIDLSSPACRVSSRAQAATQQPSAAGHTNVSEVK